MASHFSKVVLDLKKLPGIGLKSAERIAFHLLEKRDNTELLIDHLDGLLEHTLFCEICGLISEQNPCKICSSSKRDQSLLCIIKNIQDAIIIEKSGSFKGLYHVLGGLLAPLQNIYQEDLTLNALSSRLRERNTEVKEIIFAFEKSIESEATTRLVVEVLANKNLKFSTMAMGIPAGTSLEYLDNYTLQESLSHRYQIKPD